MHIENAASLKAAIAELEQEKMIRERALIDQFNLTYESLKPINMIRDTYNEMVGSSGLRASLIDATLGVGVGILSKRVLMGSSTNFLKKIAGTILELGIANIVSKNSDKIKSAGKGLINLFSSNGKQ